LYDTLPDYQGQRIAIDSDWERISQHSDDNLAIDVPVDSPIYVLYTSGTTGKPKGCLVTHANVSRLFSATDADFGFDQNDVWTLFHSYAFDFTVWEIWGALLYGGKLVVVPYWISRAPDEFYELLIKQQVTVLNQTPSAFSQLIAVDNKRSGSDSLALRYVVFGGEALDFNALKTWVARHGLDAPQLINMYGITETTVHVTLYRISAEDMAEGGSIIGRPISDLHIHIVDAQGQRVPVGIPGEMQVAGPGVTKGYLKRDDLTAEKFIANPYVDELPLAARAHYQRLYRSGDLGRYLPDGNIEYLGRIDHQVKIRGHRIELGEIEAQISHISYIREAVVMVKGEAEDKVLVSYLLPIAGHSVDTTALRLELSKTLPEYMIPAVFVSLEAWPLTPTGKVDKKALPEPQFGVALSTDYIAPTTALEKAIESIWQQVLGIDQIGLHDNFFEMGGHSLLAVKIVNLVEQEFAIKLPLASLFQAQTIAGMAELVQQNEKGWSPLVSISNPEGKQPALFLIHAGGGMVLAYQQLALQLSQRLPDRPVYGVQAYGFEDGQEAFSDLDKLTDFYIDAIRQQQAHGPYHLAGHSFGGFLAFEIARKLLAAGEEVACLGLIDSHIPSARDARKRTDEASLMEIFLRDNFGLQLPYSQVRYLAHRDLMDVVLAMIDHQLDRRFLEASLRILKGFNQMLSTWQAQPLQLNTHASLIRAEDAVKNPLAQMARLIGRKNTLGWEKLLDGKLDYHVVAGDHNSMLQAPNVEQLASVLSQMIEPGEDSER
jgi:amino acid adenylation domain-containing protein